MRAIFKIAGVILLIAGGVVAGAFWGMHRPVLKPTIAVLAVNQGLLDAFPPGAPRDRSLLFSTAKPVLRRLDTGFDSAEQIFAMGEVEFRNLQPRRAENYYKQILGQSGDLERLTLQRMIQMYQRAYQDPEGAEVYIQQMLDQYPEYHPGDWRGLVWARSNVASRLHSQGQSQEAVEFLLPFIEEVPFDAPYDAHLWVLTNFNAFEAAGRSDEAKAMLQQTLDGLKQARADFVPEQALNLDLPAEALVIHRHFDEGGFYPSRAEATIAKFDSQIRQLEAFLADEF